MYRIIFEALIKAIEKHDSGSDDLKSRFQHIIPMRTLEDLLLSSTFVVRRPFFAACSSFPSFSAAF